MPQENKRKKKSYYTQSKKPKHEFHLDAGMKGFLITCNRNESRAVTEAYRLFNEYHDILYPKQLDESKIEDDDIKSCALSYVNDTSADGKRFQNVDTKTNNCVFIKAMLEHPEKLTQKIFSDSLKSGIVKSKTILRLLPVLGTCKVNEEKLEKMAEEVFSDYFKRNPSTSFTYCIVYKIRCNNSINKEMIFSIVGRALRTLDVEIKVNFDNPDIVISVDVLQKICCLSILPEYFKFKKYNLHELGNNSSETPKEELSRSDVLEGAKDETQREELSQNSDKLEDGSSQAPKEKFQKDNLQEVDNQQETPEEELLERDN